MLTAGTPIAPTFDAHSAGSSAIVALFSQTLVICGAIFLLVAALVAWCILRFRAALNAGEPKQVHGNQRLEVMWTAGPILILGWLLFLTARAMAIADPARSGTPDLKVIAHQWWWEARYPSGVFTANEIHIPVGHKLVVELESADVIHDFWVPQLARKIDVTPGYPTQVVLEADAAGTYAGTCAEYCGAQHAWMRFSVVAESEEDFAAWQQRQLQPAPHPTDPAALRGETGFRTRTCSQCHGIETGGHGPLPRAAPDLTHLFSRSTLAAGLLPTNPENLAAWLTDPQGLKPGCHMPSLQLSNEDVGDLVRYFETLR